jgi:L-fucose isomerase-like protein
MKPVTLGVIFGNRDFFPTRLVSGARQDIGRIFTEFGIEGVMLGAEEPAFGSVETYEHAKRCAELFQQQRERIDGILVVLPNFGDEKGVADTLKLSGLTVPVLVQAYPDELDALDPANRRDAYCGKISVCSNLRQYGFPYTLTGQHTIHPLDEGFKADLHQFIGVCRVVNGLRRARLGAIGARPGAFNTVRYSEKLLQAQGISVVTADFSEILGNAARLLDDDPAVTAKLEEINAYAPHSTVPTTAILRMAKLAVVISGWMRANDLDASALQCWTSVQRNYGVNVCTLMSMMGQQLMPSACEVDVTGVASMYALQLASGRPAALVDWNNNYGGDPNRCVLFHCGNWPREFLPDMEIKSAPILGSTIGEENTFGALWGRTPAGPMSYARISTDDVDGMVRAYVGEGRFTDDPLDTFGSRAVVEVPQLQRLMKYICKNGFEHHVAMGPGNTAAVLAEAFDTYFDWDVYHHEG